jgi:hypothetical protein
MVRGLSASEIYKHLTICQVKQVNALFSVTQGNRVLGHGVRNLFNSQLYRTVLNESWSCSVRMAISAPYKHRTSTGNYAGIHYLLNLRRWIVDFA